MMESSLLKMSSLALTAGVACVIIWRTWKWVEGRGSSSNKKANNENKPEDFSSHQYICTKTISIVNTADEWDTAYNQLQEDLTINKVLGMDCEWVDKNKVALLQLCSSNGFCVLVRLFKLKSPYPSTLISLLADRSILKTGVAIVDDGKKLHRDYGFYVSGCLDLRHLLHRMKLHSDSLGLKGLASKILNIDMNKDTAVRCSNWEAETYTEQQINYAATDAAVGVDIFVQLVLQKIERKTSKSSFYSDGQEKSPDFTESTSEKVVQNPSTCASHLNQYFPSTSKDDSDISKRDQELTSNILEDHDQESNLTASHENLKGSDQSLPEYEDNRQCNGIESSISVDNDVQFWKMACSLCQGLVDVGYNYKTKAGQSSVTKKPVNKKGTTAAYMKRQRPLWDNCRLQAPDGSILCTCDERKAQWYIHKSLGDKVSDDPLTVRLRFEPSSRPQSERNYYLQEKENQCVVCGQDSDYVRKFVIPYEYKKHFPSALKDHSSHDVLLLCMNCHRISCDFDSKFRLQLAIECDAPVESGSTAKTVLDHDLQKVRSAGRALKTNISSIPEKRVEELKQTLLKFFGVDVLSDDLIEQAAEIVAKQVADGFVPHGKRVVRHMSKNGGLLAFQTRWRQHFLDTMNPQFLPAFWSVAYVPEGWSGLQMLS